MAKRRSRKKDPIEIPSDSEQRIGPAIEEALRNAGVMKGSEIEPPKDKHQDNGAPSSEQPRQETAQPEDKNGEKPSQGGEPTTHNGDQKNDKWGDKFRYSPGEAIDIGNGRYAHFRMDKRFGQAQIYFSAPKGVDPKPDYEIIAELKGLGWKWDFKQEKKPWCHPLDKSTAEHQNARSESFEALHDQFMGIILAYRDKKGLTPLTSAKGWNR